MIEIIIFILPTFLSLVVNDKFDYNKKTVYGIFKTFGGYCCLVNLITMTILFMYKAGDFNITEHINSFGFIFKYFSLSSVLAAILPILVEFIKKNISLNFVFKEVKNEKNN